MNCFWGMCLASLQVITDEEFSSPEPVTAIPITAGGDSEMSPEGKWCLPLRLIWWNNHEFHLVIIPVDMVQPSCPHRRRPKPRSRLNGISLPCKFIHPIGEMAGKEWKCRNRPAFLVRDGCLGSTEVAALACLTSRRTEMLKYLRDNNLSIDLETMNPVEIPRDPLAKVEAMFPFPAANVKAKYCLGSTPKPSDFVKAILVRVKGKEGAR